MGATLLFRSRPRSCTHCRHRCGPRLPSLTIALAVAVAPCFLPALDGAGAPRNAGVGSQRTRPYAGSGCSLLASTEGSLALTRPKCVHLMPSFPRVPKMSPNSSC